MERNHNELQKNFKNEVSLFLDSQSPDSKTWLFNNITGRFDPSSIACPLYPASLSPICSHVFDRPASENASTFYDKHNGIITDPQCADWISTGKLTLRPNLPITNPIEYQIVVLDYANTDFRDYTIIAALGADGAARMMKVHELDGQIMPFRGLRRPHPKYAFMHFLCAVGKAHLLRGDVGSIELVEYWRGIFVSGATSDGTKPASWYNKAALRVLARYLDDDEILRPILAPLVEAIRRLRGWKG